MKHPARYLPILVTFVVVLDLAAIWYLEFGENLPPLMDTIRVFGEGLGALTTGPIEAMPVAMAVALGLDFAFEFYPQRADLPAPSESEVIDGPGCTQPGAEPNAGATE